MSELEGKEETKSGDDGPDETVKEYISPRFKTKVFEKMESLRKEGAFCDITLKIGSHEWKAHKHVLSAFSDYFYALFTSDMKEKHQDTIELKEIDPDIAETFINFAYSGILKMTSSNVQKLLQIADLWQVEEAKRGCGNFIAKQVDCSNCLEFVRLADSFTCSSLYKAASHCALKNISEICESEEFKNLPQDMLIKLITRKDSKRLDETVESEVYKAVIKWIKEKEERTESFTQIVKYLHLNRMSRKGLAEALLSEPLLHNNPECLKLFSDALAQNIIYVDGTNLVSNVLSLLTSRYYDSDSSTEEVYYGYRDSYSSDDW